MTDRRRLHHHSIDHNTFGLEVWADDPNIHTDPRNVTLYVSGDDTNYVELTPAEARALAALLILAADQQEKAS